MDKTLKIYEDGSELKVSGIAAAVGVGVVLTAGWIAILEIKERRHWRRIARKYNQMQTEK